MFIRLFIVYFILPSQILASCPYIRTSTILTECIFDTNLYLSLGAHIFNSNSIDFIGHYSLNNTDNRISNTLIYNLGHRWMFLVPLLLKCAHQPINLTFTECQYTMRQSKYTLKSSNSIVEYMTTQLSVINMTDLGMQSVLFLQPGEISLRSCKAYDCSKQLVYLTASNETFDFRIDYEKPTGTKCQSNLDCNTRYSLRDLIQCDQVSQTCQCSDENITTVDIPNIGRLCTDSIDRSNCTKHPQRCLQWCNESKTSFCICPTYTRKVRKIDGMFECELEPTGLCRFKDDEEIGWNIRKCPTGTICDGYRCRPLTVFRQIYNDLPEESTTSKSNLLSSTIKQTPSNFIRILVIITLASLLFFILIIFIIAMLIKTHRFRLTSSSEDKVSSSSFTHTTSSNDYPNEIYQFKPQSILSYDYSRRYGNYLPTFLPGLVPQTNLSSRFYRQYQGFNDQHKRVPLRIQSPSLSSSNPGFLTANKRAIHRPIITHLKNGDVLISA